MPRYVLVAVMSGFGALSGLARGAGAGPLVWDQSSIAGSPVRSLGDFVVANDFETSSATRLRSADVLLVDGTENDDGALSTFGGTLGWAVYTSTDVGPGTLIADGVSTGVVQQDTHLQAGDADVVRVHFELDQPVSLSVGTSYWFALREGAWDTAADGSDVHWVASSTLRLSDAFWAPGVSPPSGWFDDAKNPVDYAFVLYGDAVVWNQGSVVSGESSTSITSFVVANDFALGEGASFSALEVWLDDTDELGPFDNFSGELSWAIYSNESDAPATLLDTGPGLGIRVTSTALESIDGAAIARIEMSFGRTLDLGAGAYWLALHEGIWGQGGDESWVGWVWGTQLSGSSMHFSSNLDPPGPWTPLGFTDGAFVLGDQLVFGSGFDDGTFCAWDGFADPCD